MTMQQKTVCPALTAVFILGLLLVAGSAAAETVEVDGNGNVLRILNLELNFDQDEFDGFYDIEFVTDTGVNQYSDPPEFDVLVAEDAVAILPQITGALNGSSPVPTAASSTGSDEFFIPGFEFPIIGTGRVLYQAVGAEFNNGVWGDCKDDCVAGVRPLSPDELETYARVTPASGEPPPPGDEVAIAASSLPSSRSVQVGNVATAFATIINGGSVTATDCSIGPGTPVVAADFVYQTTDASNVPTGGPNTPADIPAGGSQNYLFGFTPTAPIDPTEVQLTYDCSNSAPAPVTVGLNTLLLSASASPVPDIVALAATLSGDGILNLPGTNGANAFAVSTVNVGSTATITATPALSSAGLPVALSICETNPATGACLSDAGSSATSSVSGGGTSTYSVFAAGAGTVPFDPVNNRIVVKFRDGGNVVRGSTSVAVRTQ